MATKKTRITDKQGTDEQMLEGLKRETFQYFLYEFDPHTGLVPDCTTPGAPASIATTGMALLSYIVGVERGYLSRKEARKRTLRIMKFFLNSKQGSNPNATGYKGFYYHFLHMRTGRRAWKSELSTIDTAFLCAAMLACTEYFTSMDSKESEIRRIARKLYLRVDWQWACQGKPTLTHGWKPERGFLKYRWNKNYNEAHILYLLALGSPTFPISERGYLDWTKTFRLSSHYGIKYLAAGPLFIHQISQIWIDFRNIRDDFNRRVGFDYFVNSQKATYAQREYAIDNPKHYSGYGKNVWGFTASNGPGPAKLKIDGEVRKFYGYIARGAPHDIDDGTVSPWASASSLPFAPDIVLQNIRHSIEQLALKNREQCYGLYSSFNLTFPRNSQYPYGWASPHKYGLNQGPVILMIENYQTGLIWKLMRNCPYIGRGLFRAGFRDAKTYPK